MNRQYLSDIVLAVGRLPNNTTEPILLRTVGFQGRMLARSVQMLDAGRIVTKTLYSTPAGDIVHTEDIQVAHETVSELLIRPAQLDGEDVDLAEATGLAAPLTLMEYLGEPMDDDDRPF